MARRIGIGALAILVLAALGACQSRPELTWYEATCARKGYEQGSPAYQACVQREIDWIRTRSQPSRPSQPGG